MKNKTYKVLAGAVLMVSAASCGDSFLDTPMYNAIDGATALDNVDNIGSALNGTYNRLYDYRFSGDYATIFGDILSDITYWNQDNAHYNQVYEATYMDTYYPFTYIWQYGYKVVDNASRIIVACDKLSADEANAGRLDELALYKGEALCLRAYAMSIMTNVFGHQVKVDGQDFSSQLGVVVVNEPVEAFAQVERSTVGECYQQMTSDLKNALSCFNTAGGDRSDEHVFFGIAAAHGLLARISLYNEDFATASTEADAALAAGGITTLTTDPKAYAALYHDYSSNPECFVALAIDDTNNWSANSLGTLFTTYCYGPSPYLVGLYADNDIRKSIFRWTDKSGSVELPYGESVPWFGGGKFGQIANTAYATCYLINAPEMFLIKAECAARQNNIDAAKTAILPVARRNPAIASAADLPSDKDGFMSFLRDERARELFQDGLRLWDLRRWNISTNLYAINAPSVQFAIKNVKLGDLVFPIPVDEINAGFGVTQNENWSSVRPK